MTRFAMMTVAAILTMAVFGCGKTDESTSEASCTAKGGEWVCDDNHGPGGSKCWCDVSSEEDTSEPAAYEPEPQPWGQRQ